MRTGEDHVGIVEIIKQSYNRISPRTLFVNPELIEAVHMVPLKSKIISKHGDIITISHGTFFDKNLRSRERAASAASVKGCWVCAEMNRVTAANDMVTVCIQ